jgi:hypothetical protein
VKALVLSVLCLGLTLGVCLVVRRLLDGVTTGWSRRHPAKRCPPPASTRDMPQGEHLLQQLQRVRSDSGNEAVRGTLVAEFLAGQREATLYAGFCPAFQRLPHIEAHTADESIAIVKVTQRLHNGAQFDVHLAEPAEEPFALQVEFSAAEPATADPAFPTPAI